MEKMKLTGLVEQEPQAAATSLMIVRQGLEHTERLVEIIDRLLHGVPASRFAVGEDQVVGSFATVLASRVMVGEELAAVVELARIQLLECVSGATVQFPSMLFEQALVGDFLGESMLEGE